MAKTTRYMVMKKAVFLSVLLIIIFLGTADGDVFFDIAANPMFYQGQISPPAGTSSPFTIIYSFGGGVTLNSVRIGLSYHYSDLPDAFRISFSDRTDKELGLKIQGIGISIGYEREPFFVSLMLSPASFSVPTPSGFLSSTYYEINTANEWGLMAPLTAGCRWRILYLAGTISYLDWMSQTSVSKYELVAPYHWYLVDTQQIDSTIKGLGIGFSIGLRINI